MARLAAAGLVCAVALVLLCVEVTCGNGYDQLSLLRSMPPVRIVYKRDTSLCVGIGTDNTIVLVKRTNDSLLENKELWFLPSQLTAAGGDVNRVLSGQPFALVHANSVFAGQPQAILTPTDGSSSPLKLQLAPYDMTKVSESMLWVKGPRSSNYSDPFVKIKLFRNESWSLDGWEKSTRVGTTVTVFPATHNDSNLFWDTQNFLI